MNPAVSVIVPIYNIPDEYLHDCMQSLLRQTMKKFEVILVDDGSKKLSNAQICDDYAMRYDNFTVIHKKNEGVAVARNVGTKKAKGNWICYIDPDDWVENNYLERLYWLAEKKNSDIVFCNCYVNTEHKQLVNNFWPTEKFYWDENSKKNLLLQIMGRNSFYYPPEIAIGVPWAKLYKKDFLYSNSIGMERELRRMQDNVFNLYAFQLAKDVSYISDCLYHYRNFDKSVTHRFSPEVINDFDKLHCATKVFLDKYDEFDMFQQAYYARVIQSLYTIFHFYFYSYQYKKNFLVKRKEINKLIAREPYNLALEKLCIAKTPSSLKYLAILLKMRAYDIIGLIIRLSRK